MKSDNRINLCVPDDLLYRLEHLHGWHKGNFGGKIMDIMETALDLSDALKSNVTQEQFKAAQIKFIACCSPKLGMFDEPKVLHAVGDEVAF